MALLEVRQLESAYGESRVLFGLSLDVLRGEVVTLLGRNGAGKTTTLASVMGLVKPRRGSIRFEGAEISGCEPFEACRSGLGFVAENCRLFGGLTVAENFETARRPARSGAGRWDVAEVLDLFPDVKSFLRRHASALSGGQQRMVAIARTLLGNPTLLLLDEPSEGLAPLVVQALLERLRRLKETGATVLLAEQNVRFATELADRVYIIERGEIRYEGRPAELAAHPEVREKYLMV
jgi:branched-chain amino acid transport system ATP-binding protein